MIYKVFYQETKERSPRRETTRALYLDIDANSELYLKNEKKSKKILKKWVKKGL